jgi:SAM-dependent methyltransferase
MLSLLFDAARYRKVGSASVRMAPRSKRALRLAHSYLSEHPDAEDVACPCGHGVDLAVSQTDRHGLPYPLVLCVGCGLLRMTPQPSHETLSWFYDTVYRDIYGPDASNPERLFASMLWKGTLVVRALERAGLPIPPGPAVDVGCGGGWTLAPFRFRAWSCIGYDFDARLLSSGRRRGMDLRSGGAQQAIADGVQAGLLICAHVLEHVRDPLEHLRELTGLLAPEGLLYLELPHLERIAAHLRGDSLLYWQRAHLWEFQLEHVLALAAEAGLQTVWSERDQDSMYLLCKRSRSQPSAWPLLGAIVLESLRGYEAERRRPSNRVLSLLARVRPRLGLRARLKRWRSST